LGRAEAAGQPREQRVGFCRLDLDFFAKAMVEAARDNRLKAVGIFNSVYLTVIFRPLGGEAISIISMRRSNRNERQNHDSKKT
jgi:uncharacterized DUF497 family protein